MQTCAPEKVDLSRHANRQAVFFILWRWGYCRPYRWRGNERAGPHHFAWHSDGMTWSELLKTWHAWWWVSISWFDVLEQWNMLDKSYLMEIGLPELVDSSMFATTSDLEHPLQRLFRWRFEMFQVSLLSLLIPDSSESHWFGGWLPTCHKDESRGPEHSWVHGNSKCMITKWST